MKNVLWNWEREHKGLETGSEKGQTVKTQV